MSEQMGEQQSESGESGDSALQGIAAKRYADDGSSARERSEEEIRQRAHEIYLNRGSTEGDPVADWLEAERDVRGRSSASRTPDDLGAGDQSRDLDADEQRH